MDMQLRHTLVRFESLVSTLQILLQLLQAVGPRISVLLHALHKLFCAFNLFADMGQPGVDSNELGTLQLAWWSVSAVSQVSERGADSLLKTFFLLLDSLLLLADLKG